MVENKHKHLYFNLITLNLLFRDICKKILVERGTASKVVSPVSTLSNIDGTAKKSRLVHQLYNILD